MGQVAQVELDRRASIVWHALAKFGAKQCRRELLEDGSQTPVSVAINAKLGRAKFACDVSGFLFVGHSQTKAASSAPPTDHVVALLLRELGPVQGAKILETIAKSFEKSGELPSVEPALTEQAAAWLSRLRAKATQTVNGAVTFQVNS